MGKMMKMTFAGVFMAVVVLVIGVTSAFAAGPGSRKNFTDANGDGICDYRENVCRYMDTNADGICDRTGNGSRYTDVDGDGVCDHATRQGLARGKGFRGGDAVDRSR